MTCKCGCECANLAVTNDDFKEFVRTNVKTLIANKVMFTARDVYNFTFFMGTHNHKFNEIKYTIIKIIEESILDTSYVISVINNPADETEMCSLLYRDVKSDIAEYPLANLKSFFDIFDQMIKAEETSEDEDEEEVPEEEELPETDELPEEEELLEKNEDDEEEELLEEEEVPEEDDDDYIETDNWSYLDTIESDESGRIIIPAKYIQKIKFDNSDSRTAYVESYYIDYEDSSEPIMEIALYEDILNPDKEVILTPNYSLRLATKRVFKNETTFKVYLDVVKNTLIVCSENYDIDKE